MIKEEENNFFVSYLWCVKREDVVCFDSSLLCFSAHTLPTSHPHHHQQLYLQICGSPEVRHTCLLHVILLLFSHSFIIFIYCIFILLYSFIYYFLM